MKSQKAEDFYFIQDAVAFNIPVDTDDEFYTDLPRSKVPNFGMHTDT